MTGGEFAAALDRWQRELERRARLAAAVLGGAKIKGGCAAKKRGQARDPLGGTALTSEDLSTVPAAPEPMPAAVLGNQEGGIPAEGTSGPQRSSALGLDKPAGYEGQVLACEQEGAATDAQLGRQRTGSHVGRDLLLARVAPRTVSQPQPQPQQALLEVAAAVDWGEERPTNYDRDCAGRPRPCPWVGCKFHRFVDVTETGSLMYNLGRTTMPWTQAGGRRRDRNATRRLPVVRERHTDGCFGDSTDKVMEAFDRAADLGEPTCVLDMVVDGTSYTLEEVGDFFSLTRERVRQVEVAALAKIRAEHGDDEELADWEDTRGHHDMVLP